MNTSTQPRHYPADRDLRTPLDPPPVHHEFADLQRGKIWDDSQPWLVTSNALFRELISDPRVSNDVRRDGYPVVNQAFKDVRTKGGMNTFDRRDGDEHARVRRIVTAQFSAKRLQALRPRVEAHVNAVFDAAMAGERRADLRTDIAFPFTSHVLCEMLGVPHDDYAWFSETVETIINPRSPAQSIEAYSALNRYIDGLIEKVASDSEGLIARFALGPLADGSITRDETINLCVLLLLGGYETSANSMVLGTLALLSHPEQWADLRDHADEPAVVAGAVEELVRYISVTHWGRRRVATEDIVVDDVTIKAGEGLIFLEDVSNRDPAAFPGDPNTVDIRRDTRNHVGFAHGPHHCVGNQLARMELQIFYRTLVTRMPHLRLVGEAEQLPFRTKAQIYGVSSVPIEW